MLLGEHDYKNSGETESLRMNVVQIKNHPSYDHYTTDYDFSMLKLKSSIRFCDFPHIRPVCLPSDTSLNYAMETATTTGWGTTSSGGSLSSKLREVDVKVLTNTQCGENYSYPSSWITARMVCANVAGGGKDACQGDSGGPLVTAQGGDGVTAGQNYRLIGVVSWGVGCALQDSPGVYSRVTSQLDWIQGFMTQTGQACPAS